MNPVDLRGFVTILISLFLNNSVLQSLFIALPTHQYTKCCGVMKKISNKFITDH